MVSLLDECTFAHKYIHIVVNIKCVCVLGAGCVCGTDLQVDPALLAQAFSIGQGEPLQVTGLLGVQKESPPHQPSLFLLHTVQLQLHHPRQQLAERLLTGSECSPPAPRSLPTSCRRRRPPGFCKTTCRGHDASPQDGTS